MLTRTWLWPGIFLGVALGSLLRAAEPVPAPKAVTLAKARLEAARKTYQFVWQNYQEGLPSSSEDVYRWSVRWLDAERAASDAKADQIAAFQSHLERMRKLEKLVRDYYRIRVATITVVSAVEYYTAEAGLWLEQAKNP